MRRFCSDCRGWNGGCGADIKLNFCVLNLLRELKRFCLRVYDRCLSPLALRIVSKYTSRHLSSYGRIKFGLLRVIFAPQKCQPELKTGEPLLQEVILYGRQLTLDDLLDDNEKEKITRDMRQLLEHYDHLRNFIDDERERFVISILIYI